MKKKLAVALWLAGIATSAEARPMEDYWCNDRHHIVVWTDKSKSQADFDAGKPESERRPFETAYGIILHDKLVDRKNLQRWRFNGKDRDKNWKRLPSRLFSFDAHDLRFKGKRCVEISYTDGYPDEFKNPAK